MKSVDQIKAILAGMETDVAKVDKGEKAAKVRVRAGLMQIKNLCSEGRVEALSI